ncbi:hypothetical protein C7S13_8478 [Burkholderia cepacia]|nr:hypothetical protein [Burkholderia cepacia]
MILIHRLSHLDDKQCRPSGQQCKRLTYLFGISRRPGHNPTIEAKSRF